MVERSPDLFYWGSASYFPRKNEPLNCRAFWEPLSCRECVLRTAGKIYEGIRVVCTFLKNWKKLEPINCGGYWNQLLAASTQKSSDFASQSAASNCILELPIAKSANWKLNLAESAMRIGSLDQRERAGVN